MAEDANDGQEPGRLDRELSELLQELRVTLPGVQVLFAFLLIVPFSAGFDKLSTIQRSTYFIAFLATAVASAFLLAPAAYHRVQWRQRDKERLLRMSTRFAIAGLGLVAIAIAATTFVVTDVLYESSWAAVAAATILLLLATVWFVVPLVSRLRSAR